MSSKGVTEPGEGEIFPEIRRLLEEIRREDSCLKVTDLAVNGEDLMALGIRATRDLVRAPSLAAGTGAGRNSSQ